MQKIKNLVFDTVKSAVFLSINEEVKKELRTPVQKKRVSPRLFVLQRIGRKETVIFLNPGPPGAGRQKGGLYDDIKRIKKPGETCRS